MPQDFTATLTLTNSNTPYNWMALLIAAGFGATAALLAAQWRMPDSNGAAQVARCKSTATSIADGTAYKSGEADKDPVGGGRGDFIDANQEYWITDTAGAKVVMTVRGR